MRYALTTCFLAAFAANAFAAGNVLVSAQTTADLQPLTFDADLSQMTPAQFREFAKSYNAGQVAAAKQRHVEYLRQRGGLATKQISESSGSTNMRTGGGLGYGGFGGAGGYAGYSGATSGGGSSGFAGGNGGMGMGGMPNNVRSGYENESESYQSVYPDMNDDGGGPVTIINPYCYEYWVRQAGHYAIARRPAPAAQHTAAVVPDYNLFSD